MGGPPGTIICGSGIKWMPRDHGARRTDSKSDGMRTAGKLRLKRMDGSRTGRDDLAVHAGSRTV
jgi:hypothetical protein